MNVLTILASADEETSSGAAGIISFLLLPGLLVLVYFMMIRPQRKRMREQQAMQSTLDVGDEVLLTSGMFGFITGFDDDRVWVEIDDDVQVRVTRAAIANKIDTSGAATPTSTTDDDGGGGDDDAAAGPDDSKS